jgi:hypothetical protein
MDPAGIAEAVWEVLMEWGVSTRWLNSQLACDGPWRSRLELEADPDSKLAC